MVPDAVNTMYSATGLSGITANRCTFQTRNYEIYLYFTKCLCPGVTPPAAFVSFYLTEQDILVKKLRANCSSD